MLCCTKIYESCLVEEIEQITSGASFGRCLPMVNRALGIGLSVHKTVCASNPYIISPRGRQASYVLPETHVIANYIQLPEGDPVELSHLILVSV